MRTWEWRHWSGRGGGEVRRKEARTTKKTRNTKNAAPARRARAAQSGACGHVQRCRKPPPIFTTRQRHTAKQWGAKIWCVGNGFEIDPLAIAHKVPIYQKPYARKNFASGPPQEGWQNKIYLSGGRQIMDAAINTRTPRAARSSPHTCLRLGRSGGRF